METPPGSSARRVGWCPDSASLIPPPEEYDRQGVFLCPALPFSLYFKAPSIPAQGLCFPFREISLSSPVDNPHWKSAGLVYPGREAEHRGTSAEKKAFGQIHDAQRTCCRAGLLCWEAQPRIAPPPAKQSPEHSAEAFAFF
jgi:hypothetical protein